MRFQRSQNQHYGHRPKLQVANELYHKCIVPRLLLLILQLPVHADYNDDADALYAARIAARVDTANGAKLQIVPVVGAILQHDDLFSFKIVPNKIG